MLSIVPVALAARGRGTARHFLPPFAASETGLPGEYTDAVCRAIAPLSERERSEFFRRHQNLHTTAATLPLAAFARHVRQLAEQVAADCGIERLQRQRRQRSARLWDDFETGMSKLFAQFDPETAARIKASVQAEIDRLYRQRRDDPTDRRTREQLMADALANLICGARSGRQQGTDLIVLIDLHTLIHHLNHHHHDNGGGTPDSDSHVSNDSGDSNVRGVSDVSDDVADERDHHSDGRDAPSGDGDAADTQPAESPAAHTPAGIGASSPATLTTNPEPTTTTT